MFLTADTRERRPHNEDDLRPSDFVDGWNGGEQIAADFAADLRLINKHLAI